MIHSKLKKIQLKENEKFIYEEDKIIVLSDTKPRSTKYPGSMITITNFRIILSQKMLFGGYQLRYVINIDDTGPDFNIKGGYIKCNSDKEDIHFENNKKPVIKIKTSGGNWVGILNVFVKDPKSVIEMIK
ncbi:MAG: hypothetical protein GY756_23335 [bacterium]|nr:hypothetical protein [bacterium]